VAKAAFKLLRRPLADSEPADVQAYHREVAKALSELGVAHGEEFALMPASQLEGSRVDAKTLGPFSRRSETSRQAALDNYPRAKTQRWRVLLAIFHRPRTRDALAQTLNLGDSSVDARVWELLRGGFVLESDERCRTRAGSEAAVLMVTSKGREEVRAHRDADL
jgi:DNA-binding MarR family transcriptional regulator